MRNEIVSNSGAPCSRKFPKSNPSRNVAYYKGKIRPGRILINPSRQTFLCLKRRKECSIKVGIPWRRWQMIFVVSPESISGRAEKWGIMTKLSSSSSSSIGRQRPPFIQKPDRRVTKKIIIASLLFLLYYYYITYIVVVSGGILLEASSKYY